MILFAPYVAVCCLFLVPAVSLQDPLKESIPDPHHHPVPVHQEPWQVDLAKEAKFLTMHSPVAQASDSVISPTGRWIACLFATMENDRGLCVTETQTGEYYQLVGIPLPHRPISDITWVNDTLLVFDRWSQPHYGLHYVVNVRQLQLVHAVPFPDEFFLRQQRDTLQ